ncbi:brain natriuretic peptide-like [Megalops cyprinoides]|uniref:brain natriuretic peptide-like n=1 Tax=Megalops cyprinoides TaxID=118141 RepID=UPI001864A395|nr:brain natriuretic peptide-like [Megalops cyprinoides]
MQPVTVSFYCLVLFLNAQLFSAHPVNSKTWTNEDMDVLKNLLQRLEESIPDQREVAPYQTERAEDVRFEDMALSARDNSEEPQPRISQAEVKEFLSAQDLKAVRSDSSSKKYSGCFGRRMDRIGSMSSLGCNTVGRFNPKKR